MIAAKENPIIVVIPETSIEIMDWITTVTEAAFLLQILLSFVTEFDDINSFYPIRKLDKIAIKYLKGDFIFHLIPILPVNSFGNFGETTKLFYILKCLRTKQANELLDPRLWYRQVKERYHRKLVKDCEDEVKANDMMIDRNHITILVIYKYVFDVIRLIISLIFIGYYTGIIMAIIF